MKTSATDILDDGAPSSDMLYEYLQPLMGHLANSDLTEIAINRPNEIWTEGSNGWQMHDAPGLSYNHCRQLATTLTSYNFKSVAEHKPISNCSLPTGERVAIIVPPACEPRTVSFTIRKPSTTVYSLDELESYGSFDSVKIVKNELQDFEYELLKLKQGLQMREFLDLAVKKRRNILVVGKTGSGKTTVTNSLIQCIPTHERIWTIEDVAELRLPKHGNRVHLFFSRDGEGAVKVLAKDSLAACLRGKPDRILLAELRGDEAWEFAKSIRTGHPGSISTMHANGAHEAFDQLTSFIKDSSTGSHLDPAYIKHILYTTIDVVLFYDNKKLREIYYEPEFKREQLAR